MTQDQMREALEIISTADRLEKQLDKFVLLKRDAYTKEVIGVGDPVSYREREYHRVEVPVPDEARRYIFRLWQRETTLKYNDCVRRLNQLGAQSKHRLRSLECVTAPDIGTGVPDHD